METRKTLQTSSPLSNTPTADSYIRTKRTIAQIMAGSGSMLWGRAGIPKEKEDPERKTVNREYVESVVTCLPQGIVVLD